MSELPESIDAIEPCNADFTIRADGVWTYDESPIDRMRLVRLFNTILIRDEEGEYWLKTPVERCRITVEDMPYVAVDMQIEHEGTDNQHIHFTTNLDETVTLDADHPLITDAKGPAIVVRDGLYARVSRPVYYRLAELALQQAGEVQPQQVKVRSAGQLFEL